MKLVAFDVETSGTQPEFALQPFRVRTGDAWLTSYAWCRTPGLSLATFEDRGHCLQPKTSQLRAFLNACSERGETIVGWNTPFDVAWLIALGLREEVLKCKWLDAMLLWRHLSISPDIINSHPKSYGLKAAVKQFFPEHAGYEKDIDFNATAPDALERLGRYNVHDAQYTFDLTQKFLDGMPPQMLRAAVLEASCIPMVAESMVQGIAIDPAAAHALDQKLDESAKVAFVTLRMSGEQVTPEVLASPKQLAELLFRDWGLRIRKLTEKGTPSTDKEVLQELAVMDPRAAHVHTYRESNNNRKKFVTAPIESLAYNADGRTRPAAKIYGTYCVPGDVEVLTRDGWQNLAQWTGGEIMQVTPDRRAKFLPANKFTGPEVSSWVRIKHSRIDCLFTHGHTVPYLKQKTFDWATTQAGEMLTCGSVKYIPTAVESLFEGDLTAAKIRVLVMVQADGCFLTKRGTLRPMLKFTFKKQRKIDRCEQLLTYAGIPYRRYVCDKYPDRVEIHIGARSLPDWLTPDKKFFGSWLLNCSQSAAEAFVDEVVHWDGSEHADANGVKYFSAIKQNTEWVVTMASLVGRKASLHQKDGACWTCHVSQLGPHAAVVAKNHVRETDTAPQTCYCPETTSGFWLARSRGKIFVTGNTGRMTYSSKQGRGVNEKQTGIALHQWKRKKEFRDLIVAPEGYDLLEFDFSGQEYRWMAVESNDPTMLQLCMPGEDAHSYMGARIANIDYRDLIAAVGAEQPEAKNQRQFGKVSNLSCQYRTSAGTLQRVARVQYGVNMTEVEACAVHATYQTTYRAVPVYWKKQIYAAKKFGYVETIAGRRIQLLTGEHWGKDNRWGIESTSINFPIQGAGADQKYLALAVLKNYLPKVDGRFYFELHDGLFIIVPKAKSAKSAIEVKHLLSNLPYKKAWGVSLPIKFPVDAKVGTAWGALKVIHD